MREILFRGKRKDNDQWIQGDLRQYSETSKGIFDYELKHTIQVVPETVSQYTGLKDKNGVKIFENDILKFKYVGKNFGLIGVQNVIFENGQFGVKWGWHKDFKCLTGFANTTIEIIGNTVDNIGLLSEEITM